MTTDKTKIAILGTPGLGKTALLDAILKSEKADFWPGLVITVQRDTEYQHDRIDHDGTRRRVQPHTPPPFTATVLVVVPATIGRVEALICKGNDGYQGSVQPSMAEWVQEACAAAGLDPDQRVILVSRHEATPGNAIFLNKIDYTLKGYNEHTEHFALFPTDD